MPVTIPRRPLEEIGRLADEVYVRLIVPQLDPADHGKYIAIEVDTGAFEVDRKAHAATSRLKSRIPDAEVFLSKVGEPAAYRIR